ncbi:MAG TPA: DUF736 domain-containing protein [Stellaceae bacterium]|nr:DUF736 domain-containing protein [Stellaceae bacterium]
MIIGKFQHIQDEREDFYRGNIITMSLAYFKIRILRVSGRGSDDPDFRVVAESWEHEVEVGAGWKRTNSRGCEFVAITIDDPGLPAPIEAALVPDGYDVDSFDLEWTRPKPNEAV